MLKTTPARVSGLDSVPNMDTTDFSEHSLLITMAEEELSTSNYTYIDNPPDENMRFGAKNIMVIATYANLIWISLLGNGVVLWKLYGRKNRSRVHFMLLHLCIADLLVTLVEMPLQIAWKSTVQWKAGDFACRLIAGLRVVGLYLNAFLLIAISVDRYMSVWDPLSTARRATIRAKGMVLLSWILAFLCASPQLTVWSVKSHPDFPWYRQCVTFGAFQSRAAELAYGIWITVLMYELPLVTIIACYLGIWVKISQYSRRSRQQGQDQQTGSIEQLSSQDFRLICPQGDFLSKAKSRTLRMTALVVAIFIACWSPYQIIHIWYYLDRESANNVNQLIQEILFIFGVSSSVVDPYVYGLYSMGIWKEMKLKWRTGMRWRKESKRVSFTANGPKDLLGDSSAGGGPFQLKAGNTIFHFHKAYKKYNGVLCPATC